MHSTTDRRRAVGVAFFVSSFAKLTVHVTFELLIAVMGIGNYFWMVAVICFCGVFQFQIPRFANRHAVKVIDLTMFNSILLNYLENLG